MLSTIFICVLIFIWLILYTVTLYYEKLSIDCTKVPNIKCFNDWKCLDSNGIPVDHPNFENIKSAAATPLGSQTPPECIPIDYSKMPNATTSTGVSAYQTDTSNGYYTPPYLIGTKLSCDPNKYVEPNKDNGLCSPSSICTN